jgi:galactonate dehydratase
MPSLPLFKSSLRRRDALAAFSAVGLSALSPEAIDAQEQRNRNAPVPAKDNLKITKLETILLKPRWLFLKIHTNAGIVGLGDPSPRAERLPVPKRSRKSSPIWWVKIRGRLPNTGR